MRKRRLIIMLTVVAMVMGAMAPASAGDAACVNGGIFAATDWDNHGSHITGNYVNPGDPGPAEGARGRPAHFGGGPGDPTPGATFCNQHGQGGTNAANPAGPGGP